MEDEIRVISSSYITDNGSVAVELFGRNMKGESFTLLYRNSSLFSRYRTNGGRTEENEFLR